MERTHGKYIPPNVTATAFNCPHCGALAAQTWYSAHGKALEDNKTPRIVSKETISVDDIDDEGLKKRESIF